MLDSFSAYFRHFGSEAYSYQTVLIELLLIGAVVYLVLRFLRGTRGAGLLKGLVVLVLASSFVVDVLASRFGWQRIEFLYSKYVSALILAVLIIFQPELRRAIMRLGETRWLRRWTSDVENVIEELVRAASYLSARKIGAIIAIERENGLGFLTDTGTKIDAQVSAELLNTIFWPGSPLHDMGVVIRSGRCEAANCQFPLAEAENLPTEYGSRHRAALGLSYESDALIIVISEETGIISLAERGRFVRHLTPEELGQRLRQGLATDKPEQAATVEDEPAALAPAAGSTKA